MGEQVGIEVIEQAAETLAKGIILGKHVYADKKFSLDDLKYLPDATDFLKSAIDVGTKLKELGVEFKDLDSSEILKLVSLGIEKVKEVEKA